MPGDGHDELGKELREAYEAVLREPVPADMAAMLTGLGNELAGAPKGGQGAPAGSHAGGAATGQ